MDHVPGNQIPVLMVYIFPILHFYSNFFGKLYTAGIEFDFLEYDL